MSNYQLYIRKKGSPGLRKVLIIEWAQLDTGNETIAITSVSNDIGELEYRYNNKSNTIKLPRTPANDKVFEHMAHINADTDMPYRRHACRLVVDGIELMGGSESRMDEEDDYYGASLVVQRVTPDAYEVIIYAGNYDLFSRLKTKSLKDLDKHLDKRLENGLDLRTIPWHIDSMDKKPSDEVFFPIIDWARKDKGAGCIDTTTTPYPTIMADKLYPAITLSHLLNTMVGAHGYKLETDIVDNLEYKQAIVPCVSQKGLKLKPEVWEGAYIQNDPAPDVNWRFLPEKYGEITGSNIDIEEGKNTVYIDYIAPKNGAYIFEYSFSIRSYVVNKYDTLSYAEVELYAEGGRSGRRNFIKTNTYRKTNAVTGRSDKFKIDMIEDEKLRMAIRTFGSHAEVKDIKLKCMSLKSPTTYYGADFPIADNLPDMKQIDFFKAFCQMYGLTTFLDVKNRVVKAYTFDRIYENRSKARDWSRKLDNTKSGVIFTFKDYAQRNIIKYKEIEITYDDEEEAKLTSEGCIDVIDTTLDAEKTLFELPFSTVEEVEIDKEKLPQIAKLRWFDSEEKTKDDALNPVVLTWFEWKNEEEKIRKVDFILKAPNNKGQRETREMVFAHFSDINSATLINNFYTRLKQDILTKVRVYTEYVNLTVADIADFDHTVPIYLDKHNAYFYVNRIKNFKAGKLTEVELIKL